jgi:DNA polymerase I-like protein with 3'-5' exonuclease and polymerase domains
MLYGMGPAQLAAQTGAADAAAGRVLMTSFLDAFPGVRQWLATTVAHCEAHGFVHTLGGRRRYLPHVHAEDPTARARARRQAVNTACQASAADLLKRALIALHARLAALAVDGGAPPARLVLQVHDEVVLEVRRDAVVTVAAAVRACMSAAGGALRVPLTVKVSVGERWGSLVPLA